MTFPLPEFKTGAKLSQWDEYVASVMRDVVTPSTPEAIEYMTDNDAPFADFLADECVYSEALGVWFLNDDQAESRLQDAEQVASWAGYSFAASVPTTNRAEAM